MKRVYLNTPKEVIKALKDGKIIKSKYGHTYKIVDGFVVDDNNLLNPIIDCSDYSELHIDEQEPIKIEIGKFYKTRNGEKVICLYKDMEACYVHIINSHNRCYWVNEHGKYTSVKRDTDVDIIGPWEEDK